MLIKNSARKDSLYSWISKTVGVVRLQFGLPEMCTARGCRFSFARLLALDLPRMKLLRFLRNEEGIIEETTIRASNRSYDCSSSFANFTARED